MFFIPIEFIPYEEGDECIYLGNEGNFITGDLNTDCTLNVLDVVTMVNLILSEDCILEADMNSDTYCNVLDIVQLVNLILPT